MNMITLLNIGNYIPIIGINMYKNFKPIHYHIQNPSNHWNISGHPPAAQSFRSLGEFGIHVQQHVLQLIGGNRAISIFVLSWAVTTREARIPGYLSHAITVAYSSTLLPACAWGYWPLTKWPMPERYQPQADPPGPPNCMGFFGEPWFGGSVCHWWQWQVLWRKWSNSYEVLLFRIHLAAPLP